VPEVRGELVAAAVATRDGLAPRKQEHAKTVELTAGEQSLVDRIIGAIAGEPPAHGHTHETSGGERR
jgi:hypothetical protein